MTARLVLGTRNPGKVAELRALLRGLDLELVDVADLPDAPPEPPEDAPSYAENAVAKAIAYASATGLATVADDSGLEVDALGGAPGVRSRRFFGDDVTPAERNRMLLALLDGVRDRTARFVAVIALAQPDGRVETFDGEVRGEIAESPRGEDGFGYDPVFVIAEDGRTMAEVPREEKNAISHRGLAAAKLRAALASGR
ncbi:MAG TPA: RdgB/HAM1 family non-canonical purine NTP pyrophosphatase [Candidatus Limnocylindria bacterium]|nr:RdgB/HAM1 family non-canonical purine NTP pyrophosphatase [Candidatus Limnocylindria bacterium]